MAIQKSTGNQEFRPPVESQTIKVSFWNLAHMITSGTSPHMQILGQIGSAGGSPQVSEI